MRTTINLPPDLHETVRELAHRQRRSLSDVVADLMRRGLTATSQRPAIEPKVGPRGLPIVTVGHPVTSNDVDSLEDD